MRIKAQKISWCVDHKIYNYIVTEKMDRGLQEFSSSCPKATDGFILDWGGGRGHESDKIARNCDKNVVNMDPDMGRLKSSPDGIMKVRGIGQSLPFKDNVFNGIHLCGALHHAADDIRVCTDEMNRTLQPGGVILMQEPLAYNPIANVARKLFYLECAEPDERPLKPQEFIQEVSRNFDIAHIRYYFLVSYLLPHVIGRLPLKKLFGFCAVCLSKLDEKAIELVSFTRRFAAYIEIMAYSKKKLSDD